MYLCMYLHKVDIMTSYILKDTYEELIDRDLTKKILYIMKNSEKKQLTKKAIFRKVNQRYRKNFTSDPNTIIRYLKTMEKYGLVKEINQGLGKATLWEIKKLDSDLNFQININEHINKLKGVPNLDSISYANYLGVSSNWLFNYKKNSIVNIYGFPVLDILNFDDKSSHDKYKHELYEIINSFHDAFKKLYDFKVKTFNLIYDIQYNRTKLSCNSWIDDFILFFYNISLKIGFFDSFDLKRISDDTYFLLHFMFEENKYPFVLKPNLDLLNLFDFAKKYLDKSSKKISKEELWGKLNGYQLSKDFSYNLCHLANITFDLEYYSKIYFTVLCERSLPEKASKDIAIDYITFKKLLPKILSATEKDLKKSIAKKRNLKKQNIRKKYN